MALFNSIVRGFGSQIGRTAAQTMVNSFQTNEMGSSESDTSISSIVSNSLTFDQIVKTFLWSILMIIVAMFFSTFIVVFAHGSDKEIGNDMFFTYLIRYSSVIWIICTFIIGKGYYSSNKKKNELFLARYEYNKNIQSNIEKVESIIKETEENYISNKITKREYEVLLSKANKQLKEFNKLYR